MALQDRLALRILNSVGSNVRRLGWRIAEFDPERIEAAARGRAGCNDFGAARYQAPLARLCEAYHNDKRITFFGRLVCFNILVHAMTNRAWVQRDITRHPELLQQERVQRPLFVIGLPRTGTTLLYNLLSLNPACRPLMYWESSRPSPSPRPETYSTDPRLRRARRQVSRLNRALPEMAGIHEWKADAPEECMGLLMNVFLNPFFLGHIPEYHAWLDEIPDSEIDAAYAEYRVQLQILQRYVKADHWVLKCPAHLYGLGGIFQNFPDAAVIHTHRELARSVPSMCSLNAVFDTLVYHKMESHQVGRHVVELLRQMIERGLSARERFPDAQVYDLHYEDFVQDPVRAVREIYGRFGYDYSLEFESHLRRYADEDSHHKRQRHAYTLAEFALDDAKLRRHFKDYMERFQLQEPRTQRGN